MIIGEYINKIIGNKTLVNGVFFSVFAFIGRGIAFILLIMLASYIPPSDYGKLSLFNTVVMLLGYLMAFSTNGYMGISYFKEDRKTFHQDVTFILLMLVMSACIIALVFTLWGSYISKLAGVTYNLLWCALLIAFINVPFSMQTDYYRFQEKVKMYGVMNLSNAILNAIFSLFLVITLSQGWMGRVKAQIGISVLFGFIAVSFFAKQKFYDYHLEKKRMKLIMLWGLPQIPHLMTNWIRQGCDQYIINYNYSTQEVGLFSFAFNLVGIIIMIGMAFNSSNSVTIYQVLSDKNIQDKRVVLNKNTKDIFLIYLGATLLTVFLGCVLVPIVLPKFVGSIPFFLFLSIYGFMVCMYFLYCNYLFYYGHTQKLMYITFGTSVLHLLLSLLLTQYSLYFTSVIYIFSQTFCVGLVYWYSRRLLRIKLNRNEQ